MRWGKVEEKKLKDLYLNHSMLIEEISKVLKRTPASVNNKLSRIGIKRLRSPQKLKISTTITPALVRIHAHICGDGNLARYREKDDYGYLRGYRKNYRRIRYDVNYVNKNPTLIKEFKNDAKLTFGIMPYCYKDSVRLKSKTVWVFLKNLGVAGSHSWSISKKIMRASKDVKRNWIRAFFDDEAHFDRNNKRIRVRSVNLNGLQQVSAMMRNFSLSHITPRNGKSYSDGSYYLNISRKYWEVYFDKIGSLRFSA